MRANVRDIISRHCPVPFQRALVAPCGTNADQDILDGFALETHGIDVSPAAVEQCPSHVVCRVGDVRNSGYEDASFDLVASILFFHHLHRPGFEPFLREFARVLAKDGTLVVVEPSMYYPFGWLTAAGKLVFGNVTGQVPDEAPLSPSRLTAAMRSCGFRVEIFRSVSFSHHRLPVPVQAATDTLTRPLQRLYPFSHMGWMCLWICRRD